MLREEGPQEPGIQGQSRQHSSVSLLNKPNTSDHSAQKGRYPERQCNSDPVRVLGDPNSTVIWGIMEEKPRHQTVECRSTLPCGAGSRCPSPHSSKPPGRGSCHFSCLGSGVHLQVVETHTQQSENVHKPTKLSSRTPALLLMLFHRPSMQPFRSQNLHLTLSQVRLSFKNLSASCSPP